MTERSARRECPAKGWQGRGPAGGQTQMEKNLTSGSVLKSILYFSLPYLLSYFLQTLYGMADLFIIGQFEGDHRDDRGPCHGHDGHHRAGRRCGEPFPRGKAHRQHGHPVSDGVGGAGSGAGGLCGPHHPAGVGARRSRGGRKSVPHHLLYRHPMHHGL